jgi:signal transduction histidine kinase
LKLQPADPDKVIEQAIQAVQFPAQQKNIHFHTSVQKNIPQIHADIEKTSWVLINFLTNAIKYSPEDSVIEVSVARKNNAVEFAVKDHGKGIDEKYLPKIFERYFKVPGTHDRSGTGLGLTISKEFIEAQGGKIWAESAIGEGSRFTFSIKSA